MKANIRTYEELVSENENLKKILLQKKKTESSLKKSEKKYRTDFIFLNSVLNSQNDIIIFALDKNYCYTSFTKFHKETIKKIWGIDIQIGMNMLDVILNPDDRKKAKANFDRALLGEYFVLSEEYGDKLLYRTFYENYYSSVKNSEGEIIGVSVFVIDITKQKTAELAVLEKENEKNIRIVTDNLPALVCHVDKNLKYLFTNNMYYEIFGFRSEELIGKNIIKVIGKEAFERAYPYIQRALKGEKVGFENVITDKNNCKINIQSIYVPQKTNHEVSGYFVLSWDITARKQTETELTKAKEKAEENEEKLKAISDQTSEGIALSDMNGNYIFVNPSFCKMSGYSQEELLQMTVFDMRAKSQVPGTFNESKIEKPGQPVQATLQRKDGSEYYVEIIGNIITINNQNFVLGTLKDISERVNAELALKKSEENERSRLAKELHDSLGPMLTALKLYIQTMQKIGDAPTLQNIAAKVENVLNETLQTITDVSNNISPHILRKFGLCIGIKNFPENKDLLSGININFDCDFKGRMDEIYEISLYRVIIELINNTIKHSGADKISLKIFKRNQYLFIRYSDNGKGFDIKEVTQNTTRMGLSNIQNRIRNIKGKIKFGKYRNTGFVAKIVIIIPEIANTN
jgi:PAS domain S-box-containing protein